MGKDALSQLKDIHLPAPAGWWPLAPGWYVVALIILCLMAYCLFYIHRKKVQARPKKYALSLLARYEQQYQKEGNTQLTSALVSELLRRVALVYYPRDRVASIHGQDWLQFLNATGRHIDFNAVATLLLECPFKPPVPSIASTHLMPLFHVARAWINQRDVPCSN